MEEDGKSYLVPRGGGKRAGWQWLVGRRRGRPLVWEGDVDGGDEINKGRPEEVVCRLKRTNV